MARYARAGSIIVVVAALTSGCAGDVPVKNVQSDKQGYLAKTFALPSVPSVVATAITAKDPGPLSFRKMTLSVTPKFVTLTPGTSPPNYHLTWTLINAGGPFAQYLEEQNSNGIATRQDYGISYRGVQSVRGQTMLLNQTESSWVMEMRSLDTFTALLANGGGVGNVDFHYTWGNPAQLAGMMKLSTHCEYGASYPAAKLNPKFAGVAQDLKCEHTNKNGVVSDHSTRTVLASYGVAFRTRSESATGTVIFQIDDVTIE